jgi:hypothetical protein
MNGLLLKWVDLSRDLTKLVATIVNYAFKALFMTWTLQINGEKVFGLAKCNANYSSRANYDFHRAN